jgi:hypothetical protein
MRRRVGDLVGVRHTPEHEHAASTDSQCLDVGALEPQLECRGRRGRRRGVAGEGGVGGGPHAAMRTSMTTFADGLTPNVGAAASNPQELAPDPPSDVQIRRRSASAPRWR